ncbi:pentatricopeptide repeat-containing protein At4g25270, chloroplastic-like [Coffea arabica]|uniref:Pentatricopeptide repeat-containing protein At4g25270, chloroplastic-like n=1 Tax=Coffea arabica TaxID=13443 RepID=A0A6P6VN70_COFAR|nr:pentatricopeptide repeat-containing protein At4g25270, chloroplastic-like [Coffea arabica]
MLEIGIILLQQPSLYKLSACRPLSSSSNEKTSKKQKLRQNYHPRARTKLRFPAPNPTPLLAKNYPRTKLQALEFVINEIESSIEKGIEVNDTHIFASLLETCFDLHAFDHALRIRRLIPDKLLRKNAGISSKLIRLCALNGQLDEAHHLFDQMPKRHESAFPWNSLIAGYAEKGLHEDALALYFQMVEEGLEPDRHTFPRVLKACGGIGLIQVGEEVHRHVIRYGFGNDGFALNALVDMYAKCGDIVKARKVFDRIVDKDLVSWNSMLSGYARHELITEALDIFVSMVREGLEPDSVTLSSLISSVSSSRLGTQIHGWVLRHGIEWDLSTANSLIAFYSNCNKLEEARWLFEHMPEKDLISWNSIIFAHSRNAEALFYFEQMVEANASPDAITFVSLLSACARMGLVEDGQRLFRMMRSDYGVGPIMEHYACMVNLYGRAGLIDEAYDFIVNRMDTEAGPTVWGALLYGCYLHGSVDLAEIAATALFELEPDNEHNFELLMRIYVSAGRFDDVKKVKAMMLERGLNL